MITYKDDLFYNRIMNAINTNSLILFVGAGVSKLCNLPLWEELADKLLKRCASDENCDFNYCDYEKIIKRIKDSRELVSIAYHIMKKSYDSDDAFMDALREYLALNKEKIEKQKRIKEAIFKITNSVITTNADEILDDGLTDSHILRRLIGEIDSFQPGYEKQVVHIHGSIKTNFSDLVFTTEGYLKRYKTDSFKNMLSKIINDDIYTILFIGYGFSDIQLLDFLVNIEGKLERLKRVFLLKGYLSDEEVVFDAEKNYYEEYGVSLISFLRDENDYDELINVLEFLSDNAEKKTSKKSDKLTHLIRLITKGFNDKVFDSIENEYSSLTREEKIFLLEMITSRVESNLWIRGIIQSNIMSRELFDIENEIAIEKDSDGKVVSKPFIGLNMFNRIDVPDDSLFTSFIKDLIKKVSISFMNDDNQYSNHLLYKGLFKLVFTNEKYISNEFITLLNSFSSKSREGSIWVLYLYYKNDVLIKYNKTICLRLLDYAIRDLMNYPDNYYYLGFFKKYSDSISDMYPRECYKILNKYIKNNNYDYYTDDAYETIEAKKETEDYKVISKKFMIKCIRKFDGDYVKKMFLRLIKGDVYNKRLAIFIANVFYNNLKKLFWDNISFVKSRDYYSEIFSLIKNNAKEVVSFDGDRLIEYIEEINFDTQFWTKVCQYDILESVHKYLMNEKIIVLYETIKSKITEEEWLEYSSFCSPLERSKHIWTRMADYVGDKNFNNLLQNASRDDLYALIKEASENYDYEISIKNNIKELLEKNDYIEYIISNIDNMNPLPDFFVRLLFENIYSTNISLEKKVKFVIFLDKKTNYSFNKLAFNNLFFILSGVNDNELTFITKEISDYIMKVDDVVDEKFFMKSVAKADYNFLAHNITYQKYYLLVKLSKEKLVTVRKIISNQISESDAQKKSFIEVNCRFNVALLLSV